MQNPGFCSVPSVASSSPTVPPRPWVAENQTELYRPIAWADCQTRGLLAQRLQRNFDRLETEGYRPETVFKTPEECHWWTGDIEGRTVLSLVLLAQATGRTPRFLEGILNQFPSKMNSEGFFGDVYPSDTADEQQLSSQGWVLRALCEHYLWKKDSATLELVRGILRNLALPLLGRYYPTYPIRPEDRIHGGGALGERTILEIEGRRFILSSDIGCAFIFMDGVMQAYSIEPNPQLRQLVEEMIACFLAIDLEAIKAQTHATLTALRGLLRWHQLTGDPKLLDAVVVRFEAYKRLAMSENYENWNWFGRPTHSEPCAMVDSFQVAVGLWQATGVPQWLEDAHHIAVNAIGSAQQQNGGFGLHSCAGAEESPWLELKCPEAYWCCTMRGSEGLTRLAQSAWFIGDRKATLAIPGDNRAVLRFSDGEITIDQQSTYPLTGGSCLRVDSSTTSSPVTLRLFTPSFTTGHSLRINGQPVSADSHDGFIHITRSWSCGDVIEWGFALKAYWSGPINSFTNKNLRTLRYGPMVLGVASHDSSPVTLPANAPECLRVSDHSTFFCGDIKLTPVHHAMNASWTAAEQQGAVQILF